MKFYIVLSVAKKKIEKDSSKSRKEHAIDEVCA